MTGEVGQRHTPRARPTVLEQARQPGASLGQMPAYKPKPAECICQSHATLQITRRGLAPGKNRSQIVLLDLQAIQPDSLLRTMHNPLGLLCERQIVRRVPPADSV